LTLVVDASAAGDLLFHDRWDAVIESNSELIAPDLIVAEIFNARSKIGRSGGRVPAVETILNFLTRVRIVPSLPYAPAAVQLSERLAHPIYDCLYVALARQENLKLLTADAHLARKLRSHKLGTVLA
jgi:predicted nucleic acid-binding protein